MRPLPTRGEQAHTLQLQRILNDKSGTIESAPNALRKHNFETEKTKETFTRGKVEMVNTKLAKMEEKLSGQKNTI